MTLTVEQASKAEAVIKRRFMNKLDTILASLRKPAFGNVVNNLVIEKSDKTCMTCAEGIIGLIIGMQTYELFPNANITEGNKQLGLMIEVESELYRFPYSIPIPEIILEKISINSTMKAIEEIKEFRPTDKQGRWYITTRRKAVRNNLIAKLINCEGSVTINELNDFGATSRTIANMIEECYK